MIRAIVNASPLIALDSIGHFDLLPQLFDELFVPQAVLHEIKNARSDRAYGKQKLFEALDQKFIQAYDVKDKDLVSKLYGKLHRGELEVVIGAKELNAHFAIIDEIAARKMADIMGVRTIGTIGILKLAKQQNNIRELKPLLLSLVENKFRISESLIIKILKDVGETY